MYVCYPAHKGRVGRNCALLLRKGKKGPKEDAAILRCSRGVTSRSREAIFSLHEASLRQILEAAQSWYLHFSNDIEIPEKVKKGNLKMILNNSSPGRDFRCPIYSAFQEKRQYDHTLWKYHHRDITAGTKRLFKLGDKGVTRTQILN